MRRFTPTPSLVYEHSVFSNDMLRLRAPAKLNLYLRVLAERPDGYHEIETLFERIDLADELACRADATLSLTCSDPTLSCGEDNLVLRAARLLQQDTSTRQGAAIHLLKRIPIAAGLGGASSDAASTLVGLNRLWDLGVPTARLAELGAAVGSDVPFFLQPEEFAIGRGRGERCEPLTAPALAHVLVIPEERLSTAEVYAGTQLRLTAPAPSITIVQHALRNGSLCELAEGLWNDLEPEAIRRCPVIVTIHARLRDLGCLGARMSGSGTAVFGLCRDPGHAEEVARQLRCQPGHAGWRVEVVQTSKAARGSGAVVNGE